jgi:alkanesulfonate monooxygenase SsuD/methylene tetrahydromethanopterin reductase-like flavin-dependent oxidoreductase (luciferase family)
MRGDVAHRWTQTQEAIMAMKALWTTDVAEYHGRYYDFPPVRSFPKPAQKPHPPIILGSITSRRVFRTSAGTMASIATEWARLSRR